MSGTNLLEGFFFCHFVQPERTAINSHSNIGLFAQPLHALHIVLHGSGVGDLCGTASRKPASFSISHSLPVAPG